MRPKSLILLALALGCGLIASIGINQVLANRNAPAGNETVDILVAAMDIPMGDPMSPEFVRVQPWPKEQLPEGAITSLKEIEERRTRTKFFPGEPILHAKLFGRGEAGESATDLIPKGYRVLPVKVDAVTGGGAMILPGDRVDVMVHVTEDPHRGIPRTTTRTFLQNVKVFAVDNLFSQRGQDGEQSLAAKTISLLVTPEQSELVAMATQLGSVTLVMRGADDPEENITDGASPTDIFGGLVGTSTAPANPGPAPDPNAASDLLDILRDTRDAAINNTPVVPPFRMVLIRGDQASAVEFNEGDVLPIASGGGMSGGAGFGLGLPGAIAPVEDHPEPDTTQPLPELPIDSE